jgi:hypothetical protein
MREKGGDYMKRKTNTVVVSMTSVNNQKDSPVINLVCDYPEIVIGDYKYIEHSIAHHIWNKGGKIVLSSDNSNVIESCIDLKIMSQLLHRQYRESYELYIKDLIELCVKEVLLEFMLHKVIDKGFENFRLEPIDTYVAKFVAFCYEHIADELGFNS